ncbi:hypothetical protein GCM10010497_61170 [Streptomyces cinereoruber]|uniref:Uncharacterized protein n=1 Tax=Streptomyces cinereoruber TaxID=67260 RepID=A0AAV4KU38_9ACTN|nr:hypothetical protein [Streptomyces cinereoruber]MBB4158118.1 hypothetical protein [Streptomyces cinereoruber]MBY8819345.1 hypothetical protein [Streptomyces cinereoruber]NIH61729.1 hypothetical protein [Streptomyces cinereoruber]QEV35927.1 hypothetical protein CP977_30285 [Streptomyces cinereoruber]GGR49612.1 hypothetical protein GCM10010497_61170 [Streptomyces cinereoruber]
MNRRRPRAAVRARFSVREVPGITVTAAGSRAPLPYGLDGTARRTAQRALTEAGRAYLGGHVELHAPRRTPARVLRGAATRAVAAAVATTLRAAPAGPRATDAPAPTPATDVPAPAPPSGARRTPARPRSRPPTDHHRTGSRPHGPAHH